MSTVLLKRPEYHSETEYGHQSLKLNKTTDFLSKPWYVLCLTILLNIILNDFSIHRRKDSKRIVIWLALQQDVTSGKNWGKYLSKHNREKPESSRSEGHSGQNMIWVGYYKSSVNEPPIFIEKCEVNSSKLTKKNVMTLDENDLVSKYNN